MTRPAHARPATAALLLSVSAGAIDAFTFLQLGGVFTANMTGNVILAAMYSRPGYGQTIAGAATAILAFVVALYVGFRLTRTTEDAGDRHVPRPLQLALLAQLAACVTWLVRERTHGPLVLPTIALMSVALALQTVWSSRASELRGLTTTTYVTGAMTSAMRELADHRRVSWLRVLPIVALFVGALAGTAAVAVAPVIAPCIPLVATAGAVRLIRRHCGDDSGGG